MLDFPRTLAAISLCSASLFGAPCFAQDNPQQDVQQQEAAPAIQDSTPSPAAEAGTSPQPEADTSPVEQQSATAAPVQLGQGTKEQAEHSAQATARKSVSDPNNQLGTSLQGRTRPIAGENKGPPYDTAAADTAPADAAPEKIEE